MKPNNCLSIKSYRIKQVDKDGRFTLSKVTTLQATDRELVWYISPNPASGKANLVILSPKEQGGTILLSSLSGQLLCQQAAALRKGSNTVSLPGFHRVYTL